MADLNQKKGKRRANFEQLVSAIRSVDTLEPHNRGSSGSRNTNSGGARKPLSGSAYQVKQTELAETSKISRAARLRCVTAARPKNTCFSASATELLNRSEIKYFCWLSRRGFWAAVCPVEARIVV